MQLQVIVIVKCTVNGWIYAAEVAEKKTFYDDVTNSDDEGNYVYCHKFTLMLVGHLTRVNPSPI